MNEPLDVGLIRFRGKCKLALAKSLEKAAERISPSKRDDPSLWRRYVISSLWWSLFVSLYALSRGPYRNPWGVCIVMSIGVSLVNAIVLVLKRIGRARRR
jgi:hypothetical protein